MKKIIEHGYKYHMETACPNCGCRFSYEWEDVLKTNFYLYKYSNIYTNPAYRITCPECGVEFELLNWNFNWSSEPIKFTCSCDESGCKIKNEKN